MKPGNILIAIFWLYLSIDAYIQGLQVPQWVQTINMPDFPIWLVTVSLLTVFATSLVVTFWQRRNLMEDLPLIAAAVDRRFGEGSYRNFNKRLHPVGISILSIFILAVTGLRATRASTNSFEAYLVSFLFLSVASGLLFALLLSRRYPPRLR